MASNQLYMETKRHASFAGKTLYHFAKDEMKLSYYYMRSNLDAAFLPFPIFATASLLYREAETDEMLSSIARIYANLSLNYNHGG
jgi:hypothetical protein